MFRAPRPPAAAVALALLLASCSDNNTPPVHDATADAGDDASVDAVVDATPPDAKTDALPDGCDYPPDPEAADPPLHTPRWAFEPWISKDISDAADTYAFVDGFRARDIPVGVVVLDSPWETSYNTFVPNPARYPDFDELVAEMHDRDVRVVLWVTQMVNVSSFDGELGGDEYVGPAETFVEAKRCDFLIDDGKTYLWWKGMGAGVDFFNPRARSWWHGLQDRLLDVVGIDGWKLDFGESYIFSDPVETAAGQRSLQQYSEAYYRDFWVYGASKRPRDFVTMVRGYDESYQFEGRFFARPEHAPVVWAGDNHRDWTGLVDALDHIFRSAAAGYVVVGSDIGGYLDFNDQDFKISIPFDRDNFLRWTAAGALMPLMQLHGRGNLTPWTVEPKTDEAVAIYRYWSWLHHELVPFFYSLAEESYAGRQPGILRPIGEQASWPGDYRYQLGEALLVAPLLDGSGKRDVTLPAGTRWYDWWNPVGDALEGGATLTAYDCTDPRKTVPLFVREGAIIPAAVDSDLTGLGDAASQDHLTVAVYPAPTKTSFALHETDDKLTTISALRTSKQAAIELSRVRRPTILRVRADAPPAGATRDGATIADRGDAAGLAAASDGYWSDSDRRLLWIKLPAKATAVKVQLSFGP